MAGRWIETGGLGDRVLVAAQSPKLPHTTRRNPSCKSLGAAELLQMGKEDRHCPCRMKDVHGRYGVRASSFPDWSCQASRNKICTIRVTSTAAHERMIKAELPTPWSRIISSAVRRPESAWCRLGDTVFSSYQTSAQEYITPTWLASQPCVCALRGLCVHAITSFR